MGNEGTEGEEKEAGKRRNDKEQMNDRKQGTIVNKGTKGKIENMREWEIGKLLGTKKTTRKVNER